MIIAIDGPAASGKGTIAKRLAARFGLPHLDTGLIYRAVGRAVMDRGERLDDPRAAERAARTLKLGTLDESRLRGKEMGEAASLVAAIPGVRAALIEAQRAFAHQPQGAVLDGRDIGTVICPDADVKIFVTASPAARAHRRTLELRGRGETIEEADVLADIRKRDARDAARDAAPLAAATDAETLDTTDLGVEGAVAAALAIVDRRMKSALTRR